MTRQANDLTAVRQEPFFRWIVKNPKLDSITASITGTDVDWLHHLYISRIDGTKIRNLQNFMMIEIKTFGAKQTNSQFDTWSIFSQMLMDAPPCPSCRKKPQKTTERGPRRCEVFSPMNGKRIIALCWGFHVLTFTSDSPSGGYTLWNGKEIDIAKLEQLLLFQLNPFTLRRTPVNFMRLHHKDRQPLLVDIT